MGRDDEGDVASGDFAVVAAAVVIVDDSAPALEDDSCRGVDAIAVVVVDAVCDGVVEGVLEVPAAAMELCTVAVAGVEVAVICEEGECVYSAGPALSNDVSIDVDVGVVGEGE